MGQLSDLNRLLGSALQGNLAGTVALTPVGGKSHAQIEVDAKDVVTGGVTTNALLNATGTMDALDITLGAQSPAIAGQPATVDATAQLNVAAKELHVATLNSHYRNQEIKLLAPTKLSFDNGFSIEGLKLGAQEAVVQVDGGIAPELNLRAPSSGSNPTDQRIRPRPSGERPVQGKRRGPRQLRCSDRQGHLGSHRRPCSQRCGPRLAGYGPDATAQLMGNSAVLDARLHAGKASSLSLTGRAPLAADGALDLKLAGTLDMGLLNPLLEARGRHVTGEIAIDTTVTGAAGDPEIGGTVRLAKGSLRDYTQGINLSDITGELSGSHGLLRIEKLTARAAPGNVSVEGTVGVLQPKMPIDLKITAKDAQPIANNIVTANLDAEITVKGTIREQMEVTGKVEIKRADVEIPSGLPPNVAVLDVRRPGEANPPPPERPVIVKLNITVDAPRQILVKGRGLDAELGGELRIRGTTDSPKVGGGFDLQRGFFTLASSKLIFTSGTVTFSGIGLKNKSIRSWISRRRRRCSTLRPRSESPALPITENRAEQFARFAPGRDPRPPVFGQPAATLSALQVVQIGAALASPERWGRPESGRQDSEGVGARSVVRGQHRPPGQHWSPTDHRRPVRSRSLCVQSRCLLQ